MSEQNVSSVPHAKATFPLCKCGHKFALRPLGRLWRCRACGRFVRFPAETARRVFGV